MAQATIAPGRRRVWLVVVGLIVALPALWIGTTLLVLGGAAKSVVSFHNGRSEPVTLVLDGAEMGRLDVGATLDRKLKPGRHRVVERTAANHSEAGELTVPEPKDALLGYRAVYLLGAGARLATVELCYGKCPFAGPNVVPFMPPSGYFPIPDRVAAGTALDEPFLAVAVADPHGAKVETHLCSLTPEGRPRCPLPR